MRARRAGARAGAGAGRRRRCRPAARRGRSITVDDRDSMRTPRRGRRRRRAAAERRGLGGARGRGVARARPRRRGYQVSSTRPSAASVARPTPSAPAVARRSSPCTLAGHAQLGERSSLARRVDRHRPAGQVDVQAPRRRRPPARRRRAARSPASRRRAARGRPRRRRRRCPRTSVSPTPRSKIRARMRVGRELAPERRRWCGWGTARVVLDRRADRRRGRAPRARRGRRRGSRTAGCRS